MTGQDNRQNQPVPTTRQPGLIGLADATVFVRAVLVSTILGTTLTVLNQPEAVFGARPFDALPLALVYLTPFAVVVVSQLFGKRQAIKDAVDRAHLRVPGLLAAASRHGIPGRAAVLGLAVGTVNTGLVAAVALAAEGDLSNLPTALIAQAFILPIIFGLFSQALAYRRTLTALQRACAVPNPTPAQP